MSAAPLRSRPLVPAATSAVTHPGTAATSRPISAAQSAVISVPERSAASTTTVSCPSAAMIRFRAGNSHRIGRDPGGISETIAPLSRIRS
jgi:hypothetical protein